MAGPHCMRDGKKLVDKSSLPGFSTASRVAGLEVHILDLGPPETDLAQEEIFPPNEILLLRSWQSRGVSQGAEKEGLMRGEGGHKTGADGWVGLS